jgi:CheW-like domain
MMSVIALTPDVSTLTTPAPTALSDRYILTQVGQCTLVFPAAWVAEIVRIERSQVLELPFYSPLLTGIVHQNGNIVPLVSAQRLLQLNPTALQETFMIVRLSGATGNLANLGLIIDRAIGSSTRPELPPTLFDLPRTSSPVTAEMILINPEWLTPELWQPQRWMPSAIA